MRKVLIQLTQVLALAMIGTSFLADASPAEPKWLVKELCDRAGGVFVFDRSGKYNCYYPPSYLSDGAQFQSVKTCTADGECAWVDWCGNRICRSPTVRGDGTRPAKPKRLEGPTVMTAGTVNDRGMGAKNGTASGAVVNGTLTAAPPNPTASSTVTHPGVANSVTSKPPSIWNGGTTLWVRKP